MVRGVRGATRIDKNEEAEILTGTAALLGALLKTNGIEPEDIAAIFFTATPDLNAAFPARAARQMGLTEVPLMCAAEIDVPRVLSRVVRILLFWNTTKSQREINHLYLKGTEILKEAK